MKKLSKKDILATTGLGTIIVVGSVGGIAGFSCVTTGLANMITDNFVTSWQNISASYLVVTNDNNMIIKHLATKSSDGKYYDIINDYKINSNTIVSVHEAVPYFIYTNKVKDKYSKGELREIIKQFNINEEYQTSKDKVKVKK